MKMKTFGLLLVCLLPTWASAQVIIQNIIYGTIAPTVVSGSSTVSATPNVTVNSGATVVYQATSSITLGPGFTVTQGGKFFAGISPSLDSDGDGIPDVWELAYGLDPHNPADASYLMASGGGLTNLQAYLGGLYPLHLTSNLTTQTTPPGYQLVLATPINQFFGVNTSSWVIAPLPLP